MLADYDECGTDGRLTKAGCTTTAGRWSRSRRSGREYSFAYEVWKTTVTEGTGYRHTFEQTHVDATQSFASTNCCVPCDYHIYLGCVIGGNVASWSLCHCQSPR